jgi:hypothetical protein
VHPCRTGAATLQVNGPRAGRKLGSSARVVATTKANFQPAFRPPAPPTAFVDAFLAALFVWARRRTGAKPIAIPSGVVDPRELRRVLIALLCAREKADAA